MPFDVEAEWVRSHPDERLTVGVGVDGSDACDAALREAALLVRPKRGDRLLLLHVSDGAKAYLPRHLQPRHLSDAYTAKSSALRVPADWVCAEKKPGQSTHDALIALAEAKRVALLVVGSFGRKGEKDEDGALGTVSGHSLRRSNCSVLVVRARGGGGGGSGGAAGGGRKYLFATDFSRAAAIAFCTLARQLAVPDRDSVVVATSTREHERVESEARFEPYRKLMAARGVRGECVLHRVDAGERVSGGILDVAASVGADVLVVGVGGYGKGLKLGSVSEELSTRANCSALILKDTADSGAGAATGAGALGLASLVLPKGTANSLARSSLPSTLPPPPSDAPGNPFARSSLREGAARGA